MSLTSIITDIFSWQSMIKSREIRNHITCHVKYNIIFCVWRQNDIICVWRQNHTICMTPEWHYMCVTPESHYLCDARITLSVYDTRMTLYVSDARMTLYVSDARITLSMWRQNHTIYVCDTIITLSVCDISIKRRATSYIYILWKQLQTLQHCNTFYLMQAAVLTVYKWWNLYLIIQIILSDKLNYNIFNIHIWGLLSATCKGISKYWIYVKPSRISNLKLPYICSCRVALSLQCVREDFVLSYYHINITWKVLFDNSMPFYDTFLRLSGTLIPAPNNLTT